jgi:putative Holliday junction resolvase
MAKFLAFDVGSKTVGIAKSDGFFANPGPTIRFEENNFDEASEKLKEIMEQEHPTTIVVGWPKNMNGSEGHRVEMVTEFINVFFEYFPDVEIKKEDERLTTKMAKGIMIEAGLSRKKQKAKKDTVAAVLILESYLAHAK